MNNINGHAYKKQTHKHNTYNSQQVSVLHSRDMLNSDTVNSVFGKQVIALYVWVIMACVLLILVMTSQTVKAQETDFIPDKRFMYNPLKSEQSHHNKSLDTRTELNNLQLEQAASFYRDNTLTSAQRAVNHDWLKRHHLGEYDTGGKALSTLLKMGFKTYWDTNGSLHLNGNTITPNTDDRQTIVGDLGYRLKMSGNKLKLAVEYEF